MSWCGEDVEAVAAQQLGSIEVPGIADCLVFGPDPGMVGDQGAGTPDPDPVQICGDLDAPPDRAGMHRVVVGIEADVVVTRQPGRIAPSHARPDRRQCQHRRFVRVDPVGRAALQHSVVAVIGSHQPVGQLGVEVCR
uniref:Uncharacterized protein n=1 Tax=Mycobacterium sp. (strain JS330) TaxID=1004011 RepID=F4ZCI1_MYCS0|nr:hypothetical protein [Mycobacterium sp. JS330]